MKDSLRFHGCRSRRRQRGVCEPETYSSQLQSHEPRADRVARTAKCASAASVRNAGQRTERSNVNGKKSLPPEQTHAENFYYQKQMQAKTPMVLVLQDGEQIHGVIEWYDKYCLKLNRIGAANLLIYKPSIKYMYKESEIGDHNK